MNFDEGQNAAITAATSNRFAIIAGSAGTGKTTIIKSIAKTLKADRENVLLVAFAGKAAARMRDATGFPSSTIHRALRYNGVFFERTTLEGESVIMDEASMVDAALLAAVMKRNPARLILVGDPAQLPPVGRGQPFHDIINLYPERVVTLQHCYRARKAVLQAAQTVRSRGVPPDELRSEGERWKIMNTGDPKRTQERILALVRDGHIDFERDIVLVARNGDSDEEPCTVKGLNRAIAEIVHGESLDTRDRNSPFKRGDRVINEKNLPALDCWNGTTGTVMNMDIDGGVWVKTDYPVQSNGSQTNHVLFPKDKRKHLKFAYALTIHKAQGSQFRRVLLAVFGRDLWGMLDRSLVYTAITRTQSSCVVMGEKRAMIGAVQKDCVKRTVIQALAGVAKEENGGGDGGD